MVSATTLVTKAERRSSPDDAFAERNCAVGDRGVQRGLIWFGVNLTWRARDDSDTRPPRPQVWEDESLKDSSLKFDPCLAALARAVRSSSIHASPLSHERFARVRSMSRRSRTDGSLASHCRASRADTPPLLSSPLTDGT